ncbi:unnamed protein product [Pocillopora meandrina]|uniref:Uncharacterized protein n=1 Tax=Pocillopora meandrina TaxID=46732 RepID=A0AAU9VSH1_9CNID|nr:unnamed protein product [Pocillopora meandrina]
MRKAREADGARKFIRSEWQTKNQVQSYFSRLSATKRRRVAKDQEQDANDEESAYLEHRVRIKEVADVISEIELTHPILFDGHNICDHVNHDTLRKLKVTTLREICAFFEIAFKARDLKATLLKKLNDMVTECSCFQEI